MNIIEEMEIAKFYATLHKQKQSDIVLALFGLFFVNLHEEFGFGKERANKLKEKVVEGLEQFEAGTLTGKDLIQMCSKFGVKLK